MSVRKIFPFLFLFLAGAILGRPLALGSLGLLMKGAIYLDKGWSFTYDSIDWNKGNILFSNVGIKAAQDFCLNSPEILIDWRKKHLEIQKPHLHFLSLPKSEQQSEWTLSIQNGILEGSGFKKARFSFEKFVSTQPGTLQLEWDNSALSVEMLQQGEELWVEAQLKNFEASLCELWPEGRGVIDGSIHLVFQSNEWKRGSIHVDFNQIGYGNFFSSLDGNLDWEGDAISQWPLSWSETKKLCETEQQRVRLVVSNGFLKGGRADIQQLKGDLSFTSGLGAKWEFEAVTLDDSIPCKWNGRAFFSQQRAYWMESDFLLSDARFWLKGNEASLGIFWEGGADRVGVLEWKLIQPFCSMLDPGASEWEMIGGQLSVSAKVVTCADQKYLWDISYSAHDFFCRKPRWEMGCKISEGSFSSEEDRGEFFVENGNFIYTLDPTKNLEAKGWTGRGHVEKGALVSSLLRGQLQGIQTELIATGSFDELSLQAKIPEGSAWIHAQVAQNLSSFVIENGDLNGFSFSGQGFVDDQFCYSLHLDRFSGPLLPVFEKLGSTVPLNGSIVSTGFGFSMTGSPSSFDWSCQCKGEVYYPGQERAFPFYCPVLEKKENDFRFDIRLKGATWDLARLYGQSQDGFLFSIDRTRSHFLGNPIALSVLRGDGGIEKLSIESEFDSRTVSSLSYFFKTQTDIFSDLPLSGNGFFSFLYDREKGSLVSLKGKDLSWSAEPFTLDLLAKGEKSSWELLQCQIQDLSLKGKVYFDRNLWRFEESVARSDRGVETCFHGTIDAASHVEFHFSKMTLDLSLLHSILGRLEVPFPPMQGTIKGEGCITWREKVESDFDFHVSQLKIGDFEWENRAPLHFSYTSPQGVSLTGLDFCSAKAHGIDLPDFNCKIDWLLYDANCSLWFLNGAHVHLPFGFLKNISELNQYLKGLDFDQSVQFCADFCGAKDFSQLACSMKEGLIPIRGAIRHVENLSLYFSRGDLWGQCHYAHQGHLLKFTWDADLSPFTSLKVAIESFEHPLEVGELPLTLYWTHDVGTGLALKEIEGSLAGLQTSFHATDQKGSLIGSARFDCSTFGQMVPPDIAELFRDLKMGQGYELKGLLSLAETGPSFSGLLSGKQFDFFGYQLRTLLAKIAISSQRVVISDLKISDSAAILKIDEILAMSVDDQPWTLSIPHLTISELRPSLLQETGGAPGTLSPLVVRELRIDDLKGLLDDSKTYTAQGELNFINSYRREHTVFDIPADLLGRIVGLDLELLTPACGTLSYELKEGKFFLKELKNSYSEGHRSEFFLVETDPVPTMDFDGKLQILVKCKQFVLFKFMESFMISIEGELNDPKFHLQKKRRFWGL